MIKSSKINMRKQKKEQKEGLTSQAQGTRGVQGDVKDQR